MKQIKITKNITIRDSNIERYLLSISKIPTITPEEECELAFRIQKGDKKALDRLVEANLRFVVSVAKKYVSPAMSLSDLITEGNIGLIIAAQRFDPTKGFKFISYAVWWIRQSMSMAIDNNGRTVRLPQNRLSKVRDLFKASAEFEKIHMREPSESELAELTGCPEDEIDKIRLDGSVIFSLDKPITNNDNSEAGTLLDVIPSEAAENSSKDQSLHTDLVTCMTCLTPRERNIISLFYGLNGGQELTLNEISCRMDLTAERVRQIKEKAIKKLRSKPQVLTLLRSYCG